MVKTMKGITQRVKLEKTPDINRYQQKLEWAKDKEGLVNSKVEDMSSKFDTIIHVFMGDPHIGVVDCDLNSVIEALEFVLNTPNAILECLGDWMNVAIADAISSIYEDLEYPNGQWKIVVDLLMQVAKQGKLSVYHSGNHCRRVFKQTGIDVAEQVTYAIGCKEASAPYYAERTFKIKKGSFVGMSHHGDGVSNIFDVKKLQAKNIKSSINTIGHLHCFYVLTREVYIPDENTGNIYKSYCLDMIVPSSGDGKYAAIKMYDEKQKGAAIVVEATIAENPMYDPNSKSDIQEQKYVPVFRQIPIRKRASTVQKEKQISLISKIISEKMPQDMLDAFEQKTKELSDILDSFNKYLSLEVRKQLITAYQDLNRKKDLSLKQVKEPKKQNSNNTNKNGNTKTV